MGLISTGAENLLDFLELRQVFSTYDRDLRDSVADVSRFPSWGSRDLWLSLEAFPRGFPTGLSHVPPWCEWILGLKSRQCRENRILCNGLRHLGHSWNGGTTHEFLSPFLCSAPPLEMHRKRREFFPEEAGKDPSSRVWRRKRSSSGVAGPSCFLWSGDRYVGELLEF